MGQWKISLRKNPELSPIMKSMVELSPIMKSMVELSSIMKSMVQLTDSGLELAGSSSNSSIDPAKKIVLGMSLTTIQSFVRYQ